MHPEVWWNLSKPQRKREIARFNALQGKRNKAREERGLPEQNEAPKADFDSLIEDAIKKLHPDSAADAPAMSCIPVGNPLDALFSLANSTPSDKMTRSKERKCKR